ncbi:glycoside hydrolase family 9 protein [Glaciecola sp. 1036]|uniref:glycoside hydrolase family 9 protein n=1 Tax=Alteromonadaceae TaxID=72275 RepID=UPI003D028E96
MRSRFLGFSKRFYQFAILSFLSIAISACGGGGSSSPSTPPTPPPPAPPPPPPPAPEGDIKVNQIGYLPSFAKVAVVPTSAATTFEVINTDTNSAVFTGNLSDEATWAPADQAVKLADFSDLTAGGSYVIRVAEFDDSPVFTIGEDSFLNVHDTALKAYYFNRASMELTAEFAGDWARPLGHPDDQVLVHASAATAERPEGTVISSPKGWYDAGDYNKYIVNSGISTYTLLAAYIHYPEFYQTRNGNIPESSNNAPDILDEIMWNLEWMASMQDPNDGGVYHKLTTASFAGTVMPHEATAQRYVVQKGTGATLNFAGVMATASRVYANIPEYANQAASYTQAAIDAYAWAVANPNVEYVQPADIQTGGYQDSNYAGEFAWAAAELYLLTADAQYLDDFNQYATGASIPGWPNTMGLAYVSLLAEGENMLATDAYISLKNSLIAVADGIVNSHSNSAYGVAMETNDFVWGSNSGAMNKAFILMQAYRQTASVEYVNAAIGLIDYVLGKNPTDYSFVTGNGSKTPQDPHHRQSFADDVSAPVPGFLVGGPHPGREDGCNYTGDQPATTYVDDWCSYATNEVTINWNAPLVYVLAALHGAQ